MKLLTLALDVMGGDFGPRITVPAALKALAANSSLSFILFGDQAQILPYLVKVPDHLMSRLQIIHTEQVVDESLPFLHAVRQSKGSAMYLAVKAVANGEADGCVSGGNTGILMALSKQLISSIPHIERPALTSLIPTLSGRSSVMLDLGANVEVDSDLLYCFAEMGNLFAQLMLGLVHPRLALLNIGVEECKGRSEIRATHQQLKQALQFNYVGFIEGDKLMNNVADVIVCDGFSGNIALKTLEGMAKNVLTLFRQSDEHSDVCYGLRRAALRVILHRQYRKLQEMNPDRHNGATLLGLSKVVVKSHGGAGINAYYYAIEYALNQIQHDIPAQLAGYFSRQAD